MKKHPASLIIVNILLIAGSVAFGAMYAMTRSLLIKTIASGLFLLLGIINRLYSGISAFTATMAMGIFFAFLRDVVLEINFMGGAVLFAVGHIMYILAYSKIENLRKADIALAAAIFIPLAGIMLFLPALDFGDNMMKIVAIVYALIISLMLAKSINNAINRANSLTLWLFIGSALFFFSDFMLLFSRFSKISPLFFYFCVNTYYPGQAVLSCRLIHVKKLRGRRIRIK